MRQLPLATSVLDRADYLRGDDGAVGRYWRDDNARVLALCGETAEIDRTVAEVRLVLARPALSDSGELPSNVFFLGLHEGVPYFGLAQEQPTEGDDGGEFRTLREVGSELTALDAELFVTTQSLTNWHRTHPRCSRCGEPTEVVRSGWVRRCPGDSSEHYPRTDPAVIMLITDPLDRALLGRRDVWPSHWFSTLAGFVEPGESAESAVVREVAEEAGVVVDPATVVCLGSQPWPFPSSIMLGFRGGAATGDDPVTDDEEIVEARWFTRDELAEQCRSGAIAVPPHLSISRHLIEDWFGSTLPGSWSRR